MTGGQTLWVAVGLAVGLHSGALASVASADELGIGDDAPALQVSEWIIGDALSLADLKGKKVAVVEHWAVWCPPCITSIPHLSELQRKHADDVVVIGLTSEDPLNTLDGVKSFVKKQGDKIGYRIAFDDGQKTYDAYMKAAGLDAIPMAFVVDKSGRVAWIGDPRDDLDAIVEQALIGKLDLVAMRKEHDARRAIEKAMENEDWSSALSALKAYRALLPPDGEKAEQADFWTLESQARAGHEAEALAFGKSIVAKSRNINLLDGYGWKLMTDDAFGSAYVDLGIAAAERANTLADGKNASVLDTLAHGKYLKDDLKGAIALEKQAISQADEAQREMFQERLEYYEEAVKEGK